MRNQIGHNEIKAIRKFAALFVSDEPISTEVISSARKIIDTRRQEAAEVHFLMGRARLVRAQRVPSSSWHVSGAS